MKRARTNFYDDAAKRSGRTTLSFKEKFGRAMLVFFGLLTVVMTVVSVEKSDRPAPLDDIEIAIAKRLAAENHIGFDEAAARVIALRPTDEDKRRYAYQKRQREKEAEAMQTGLCQQNPWLERCQ